MAHWDNVLGVMAQRGKSTVMSVNPVIADSYPINSSAGDGMLQQHGGFHFFEFFCTIGKPSDISADIELALSLGSRGVPFLVHSSGAAQNVAAREY